MTGAPADDGNSATQRMNAKRAKPAWMLSFFVSRKRMNIHPVYSFLTYPCSVTGAKIRVSGRRSHFKVFRLGYRHGIPSLVD